MEDILPQLLGKEIGIAGLLSPSRWTIRKISYVTSFVLVTPLPAIFPSKILVQDTSSKTHVPADGREPQVRWLPTKKRDLRNAVGLGTWRFFTINLPYRGPTSKKTPNDTVFLPRLLASKSFDPGPRGIRGGCHLGPCGGPAWRCFLWRWPVPKALGGWVQATGKARKYPPWN